MVAPTPPAYGVVQFTVAVRNAAHNIVNVSTLSVTAFSKVEKVGSMGSFLIFLINFVDQIITYLVFEQVP